MQKAPDANFKVCFVEKAEIECPSERSSIQKDLAAHSLPVKALLVPLVFRLHRLESSLAFHLHSVAPDIEIILSMLEKSRSFPLEAATAALSGCNLYQSILICSPVA